MNITQKFTQQILPQTTAGLLTAAGCLWLMHISLRGSPGIFEFLGGYWTIGSAALGYWYYLHRRDLQISFTALLCWAILFRVIGIIGMPLLEDDFYRYLLDGCMTVSTGTPYGVAPSSLFIENNLSPPCQQALNWVNNPDLPTIYDPLLQYIFAAAHLLSPANVNILQIIVVLFDLGVILLLKNLASTRTLLLYAWNPLIIKEIAFTAHPDIIGVFFILAAFLAVHKQQIRTGAVCLALACCVKIFALLAVPFFLCKIFYQQKNLQKSLRESFAKILQTTLIMIAIIILLWFPFILQTHTSMPVLALFAQKWQFNSAVFALINMATSDSIARLICLAGFVAWYNVYLYRYQNTAAVTPLPRMDWIFGIFLILSPVINAWYLIWLLPFAALHRGCAAWVAALVLSFTYITGLSLPETDLRAYQIAPVMRITQWLAIAAALLFDYRNGHLTRPKIPRRHTNHPESPE